METLFFTPSKGGTGTQASCAVTYHGRMLVFGGANRIIDQISEVDNCQLKRIGNLPFPYRLGGCAISQDTIFLCFSSGYSREQYDQGFFFLILLTFRDFSSNMLCCKGQLEFQQN